MSHSSDPVLSADRSDGGKAAGLTTLRSAGCRVPAFGVLRAEYPLGDDAEPPPDTLRRLREIVTGIGSGPLAVRSSADVEDGTAESFAGAFHTVLGVRATPDDLADLVAAVRTCRDSALDPTVPFPVVRPPEMHVVIQRMITPRAAGVAFTDPGSGPRAGSHLISVVPGLGEGLVSGSVDADVHLVDRAGGRLRERIGAKATRLAATADGTREVDVPVAERPVTALDDDDLRALVAELERVPALGPSGADVEFAIDDDGVWLVQARPVTREIPLPDLPAVVDRRDIVVAEDVPGGAERIWDNSNIIESFNGPTSPLTLSTAREVYRRVYDGYARSLRVPAAQLEQVASWTPELLGSFHGRVYYNLFNWYRMVGIAPGYPLNRRVLEVALGVAEPLDAATARTIRPFTFGGPVRRLVSRAVTTAVYVRRLFSLDAFVDDFLAHFDEVYARYDALDYSALSGREVLDRFESLEEELLDRWGPIMVLDAALLTLSGLLFGLTRLWLPDAPEWLGYAVISPGADIESAEPTHALRRLADRVAGDDDARELLRGGTHDEVISAIRADGPEWLRDDVEQYLDRYGFRSPDELKLEVPDLREDPGALVGMIRAAMGAGDTTGGPDAEDYLDSRLGGLRRRVYDVVRRRTSSGAAARERVRFARTRAFGMVKRMVRAMGADLARAGLLDSFEDVFLLHLDEIRELYRGAGPDTDELGRRLASRRRAREVAETLFAPARFRTWGGPITAGHLAGAGFTSLTELPAARAGDVLTGIASSTGTARGPVRVVTDPTDVEPGILVVHRTDPSWATALPSATALLIERGSPLTHIAVIARELGVPTVVQIEELTRVLRDGMEIEVDATAGTVTVLSVPGGEESR